jgi:type I restriction enzyme S subunit
MDTKALRQKVLDLAIRGKLVPQDPNDEPASVLLERIRQQKQQMVKDGKLKAKDIKNDTIIFVGEDNLHYEKFADGSVKCIEDEIPFDLPDGWAWSRLLPLTIKIGAGSTPTGGAAVYSDFGVKFIRSQNVYNDGLVLDDIAYISEDINHKKSGSIVKPKDILLNITGGSIGRCALVPDDFDTANVNQHVIIIRLVEPALRQYIHSVITSPYIQEQIFSRQVGSGRGGLSAETLSTFLVAVPPIQEQSVIQDKLRQCISSISTIAAEKTDITRLVSAAKAKILDLAIRGQLVPQDPADEPASVLLERIRAEKEELIRKGKIKRDKKESIIFRGEDNSYYEKMGNKVEKIDDEIPFELPNGWTWCRFSEVIELFSGQDLTPDKYSDIPQGIPYITGASNLENGCVIVNRWTSSATTHATIGDLLLTVKGSGIGKMAICDIEDAHIARQIMALRCRNGIRQEYLRIVVSAFLTEITDQANGIIPGIRREVVLGTLFPLPPSSEQLKISAKANCIIAKLQMIEKSLS